MTRNTGQRMGRRGFLGTAAGVTAAVGVLKASTPAVAAASRKNNTVGIGFIGCGGRGYSLMTQFKWLQNEGGGNLRLTAACDVYRPRLERMAREIGGRAYMDHRELLQDRDVDAVVIATPDHHHGYQAIDAMRAGKDLYCEKPLTHWRQFELARQVAQVARETGRVFQLGTQGMSDHAWTLIRDMIRQGVIGQPIHAECGYFRVGDFGEAGMKIDDPDAKPGADLNWEAFLGDAPRRAFSVSRFFRWRMYEDYAGGPVTDLFPHSLAPSLYALDLDFPNKAVAIGGKYRYDDREVPDPFKMLLEYNHSLALAVLGTQGNAHTTTGSRGEPGRIPVIRGWDATITIIGEEIVVTRSNKPDQELQRVPIPQGQDLKQYVKRFYECVVNRETNTGFNAEWAYRLQTALIMGALALRHNKVAVFDRMKQEIVLL